MIHASPPRWDHAIHPPLVRGPHPAAGQRGSIRAVRSLPRHPRRRPTRGSPRTPPPHSTSPSPPSPHPRVADDVTTRNHPPPRARAPHVTHPPTDAWDHPYARSHTSSSGEGDPAWSKLWGGGGRELSRGPRGGRERGGTRGGRCGDLRGTRSPPPALAARFCEMRCFSGGEATCRCGVGPQSRGGGGAHR